MITSCCPKCGTPAVSSDPFPLRRILREVAKFHVLRPVDLMSDYRTQNVLEARGHFFYRAMTETDASCGQMAAACGGKHISTVGHAVAAYCAKHRLPLPRGLRGRKLRGRQRITLQAAE